MKSSFVRVLLAVASVASMGGVTPAPAAPACSRCVIEGVVSMGGYVPDPTQIVLSGPLVGLRAMATTQGPVTAVGWVTLDASAAPDTVNGRATGTYSGVGTMVIKTWTSCVANCQAQFQRDATITVIIRGTMDAWTFQPTTTVSNKATGQIVRSPIAVTTPLGTTNYAGTISAVTL